MTTQTSDASVHQGERSPWIGLGVAVLLLVVAIAIPAVTGWNVRVRWFPPLHAEWDPRLGIGTPLALLVGVGAILRARTLSESCSWPRLLAWTYAGGLAWMIALALIDGPAGISEVLNHPYEYLGTARDTTDFPAVLREYVSRIPYSAEPNNWPVHIAGHPPGALAVFVVLTRVGLGSGLAAGLVVTAAAASTAVAVMIVLRTLGAEAAARRAAPFLVFGPAAIWQCVSADAMFAAVAAWGMVALALAATRVDRWPALGWALLAGVLLGYCVMMSYGLPLLGVLAVVVLYLGGSWRPLVPAVIAACAVVGVFAAYGFAWWEALPVLHERYWEGVAGRRPPSYWVWGNLAALAFSAGPLMYAAIASTAPRWRELAGQGVEAQTRVVLWLSGAGVAMVVLANVSQMSRAEVERIWLPFVPWLLVATALLPERWRTRGLVLQVGFALVVQHLLWTDW